VKLGTDADNKESKMHSLDGSALKISTNGNGGCSPRREHPKAKHLAETRILVVDEHPLFRHGVMDFINSQADMAVCGSGDSIPSAQKALTGCKPDLILLGLRLGSGDTLEFIKALKAQYPELLILVFSQYEETIFAERALRAGANGYLMKHAATEELLTAIRDILRGEIYVSRKIAMLAFQKSRATPQQDRPREYRNLGTIEKLSDREIHVFQVVGSGLGTKKIAEALNLSVKTIETHRENIKCKLGLHSGVELTEQATAWVTENFLSPQNGELSVVKKKKVVPFRAA
jgi:DNA-binding NarL/FixJ family response regulator